MSPFILTSVCMTSGNGIKAMGVTTKINARQNDKILFNVPISAIVAAAVRARESCTAC